MKKNGSVECWGLNEDGQGNVTGQATPPRPYLTSEPDDLCGAIRRGDIDTVRLLIDAGADVNATSPGRCDQSLFVALERGNPEIVRILVEAGADVNSVALVQSTLHIAIDGESPEIVRILVEAGADVNEILRDGDPILYWALDRSVPQVARILVDAGADVNARRSDGNPILRDVIWEATSIWCGFWSKEEPTSTR